MGEKNNAPIFSASFIMFFVHAFYGRFLCVPSIPFCVVIFVFLESSILLLIKSLNVEQFWRLTIAWNQKEKHIA